MDKTEFLQLPVVSEGAEYLVMGYLMRRNILTYKAPSRNEGYDLICIHPDPRNQVKHGKKSQLRIQVKSRYATNCDKGFPVKKAAIDAFDFLIVALLNIGRFDQRHNGLTGSLSPEFYTIPKRLVKRHHRESGGWSKVMLRDLGDQLEKYKDDVGFELIAKALGIPKPTRKTKSD